MSSSISLFFLLVLSGMAAGLLRVYIFVNKNMNWLDAQNYCRQNFKDLATITTEEENKIMKNTAGTSNTQYWIGLKRPALRSNTWQWSDGEPLNFSKLIFSTWPDCVRSDASGWCTDSCSSLYPFMCYRSLILVKENKTWDDALQYCRTHYTGLAYAFNLKNPGLIESEAAQTQTVSVWTGLRFLNGKWFWVNMDQLATPDSLPSCPMKNYRCGARNSEMHVWENRDCNEKLNFICSWGLS